MSRFLSARHGGLTPYVPGEQPQDMQYIKLNTNESPYPPTPRVAQAAAAEAGRCHLYSDPECLAVRQRLAAIYGVQTENVLLTNGSDEALSFIVMAYGDAEHPFAFNDITYGLYSVLCAVHHVPYTVMPLRTDFTVDTAVCRETVCSLMLANPNAPTGIALSRDEMESIVASRPDRLVVVDEAYVDFGGESCVPLTKKYDNLLVVQTFSKSRSLAGARLGFIIGSAALIADLEAIRCSLNPYNVNRMSLAAGAAALDENQVYMDRCQTIRTTRAHTAETLEKLGFTVLPSCTNFLFAAHPDLPGEALYRGLKARGVLVRHFSAERTAPFVRVTIGTPEQMRVFLEQTQSLLEEVTQ